MSDSLREGVAGAEGHGCEKNQRENSLSSESEHEHRFRVRDIICPAFAGGRSFQLAENGGVYCFTLNNLAAAAVLGAILNSLCLAESNHWAKFRVRIAYKEAAAAVRRYTQAEIAAKFFSVRKQFVEFLK